MASYVCACTSSVSGETVLPVIGPAAQFIQSCDKTSTQCAFTLWFNTAIAFTNDPTITLLAGHARHAMRLLGGQRSVVLYCLVALALCSMCLTNGALYMFVHAHHFFKLLILILKKRWRNAFIIALNRKSCHF